MANGDDNDLMPRRRQPQRAPFDIAFGDSIAVQQYHHGVGGTADDQYHGDPTQVMKPGATAGVGDPPSRVLIRLRQTLEEHPDYFKGKRVFLSPGTSNNPAELNDVGQILNTFKGLGDNAPASVVVPGVGPGVRNSEAVNAALGKMVNAAGFNYYDPHGLRWADGIHPANAMDMQNGAAQTIGAPPTVTAPPTTSALAPRPVAPGIQIASAGATDSPTTTQLAWVPQQFRQPIIDAATNAGVDPNLLAAVVNHESNFVPDARGSSGEIGLGQLMPATAAGLGVTNPYDINQNLSGAARYLRQQLDNPRSGGDINRALMMYNGGPGTNFQNTSYPAQVLSEYNVASGSPYTGTGFAGPPPSPYTAAPSGFESGLPTGPTVAPTTYAATPTGSGYGTGLSADPNVNIARFAEPQGYTDLNPLWGQALNPGTMRVGGAVGNVLQNQQTADTQPGGLTSLPFPGSLGTPNTGPTNEAGGPSGAAAGSTPPGQMTAQQMFALGMAQGFRGVPVSYDPWASLQRFPQNRGRPSSYLGQLTPVSDPRISVPRASYQPVSNPFFSVIRQPGRSGTGTEIAAQSASYGG